MPEGIDEEEDEMKPLEGIGTNAPVITHAFAVEKGSYGSVWKIYIEAEDRDGDMEKIAVAIHQVGYGSYPTDWILLKPEYQRHLVGYLQWNTFSSKASFLPEWTHLTVKVSIFDKANHESNEVVFPFTFESGVEDLDEDRLPPPFDRGNLPRIGYIMVDLLYEVR